MGICGAANAQSSVPHHFADSRVVVDDWTFVPIYYEDANQAKLVDGLFAYADEATRTGNNLSAVWYDKQASGWYASSWETVDLQEAIKSVSIEENIQNGLWEDFIGSPFQGVPENPKGFSGGVLVGDPVEAAVITAPDPEPLVDFLVTVGYAAADIPVIGNQACNQQAILEDLALRATGDIAAGDDSITYIPSDLCARGPIGPRPPRPPRPGNAPPWSPPGTVPTAPAWTPGGWPTTGTPPTPAWSCRTVIVGGGAHNCICSRRQRWGRWETRNGIFGPVIRWHVIVETETCADPARTTPCPPAGGPPDAAMGCTSSYSG